MLVTTLEADNFLGRILHRPYRVRRHHHQPQYQGAERDGEIIEKTRVTRCWPSVAWRGCRWNAPRAGDIVAIAGWRRPPSPTRYAT